MKKKFTMLFAALLAFAGVAKAQTAATYADGLYKIYWQSDNRGYLTYHEGDYPDEPQLSGVTLSGCADKHYASDAEGIQVAWYLYTSEKTGKSYLFEATTGKFISINPNAGAGNGKVCVLTTEVTSNAQMNLLATDGAQAGSYMFRYVIGSTNYHFCSGCGSNKDAHPVRFSTDGQTDGGNRFVFVEDENLTISNDIKNAAIAKIEAFEAKIITVTYKYVYNGQVLGTQEGVTVVKGEAYTATTAPYGIVFEYPATVSEEFNEGDEVEIPCTSTLPFAFAANYASIEHWYYVKIKGSNYLYHTDNQNYIDLSKTAVDTNNKDAYTWAFVGNPFEGFQIVNKATGEGKILSSSENTSDGNTGANTHPIMTQTPVAEGNNTYWVPSASSYQTNGFYLEQKDNPSNKMNNRDNKLAYWNGGADNGSTFQVVERGIEFTYSFIFNGEERATQVCDAVVGADYPEITALPYGAVATKPEGKVAAANAGQKISIEVSESLPFVAAADANSIKNWYYINIHTNPANTGFLQYIEANTHIACELQGQVAANNKDAYTWAFVGNIFDGFKLVNKKAGTEQAVNSTGSGNPVLGGYATGVNWQMITSRTNTAAQYFCFKYPGGECLNAPTSAKLSFWWDNDNGSTLWVTERDDAAQIRDLVNNAKEILAALGEGETVGYVTAASKADLNNAITAAEAAMNNWEGIDEAEAGLQAALANLETIQPEAGVFYTIKNNNTGRYMNVSSTVGLIATTSVGIGEVFQFVKDNGNLYLKNVERGTYLNTALPQGWGQNAAGATTLAEAKAVVVKNLGKGNQVSITPAGGATLHHDTNNNNVVAWNGSVDSKSSWSIEAVEITGLAHVVSISDVKWATLVLGYDAIIPEGVTAYAVTEAGNNVATLTEITGTIPAFEAVLLNATEAGSYDFKYAEAAEAVEGNLLAGSTIDMNVEGLGYVLAAKEGNVGLYKAALNVSTDKTNDGTEEEPVVTYEAFKNNAFKAYLPVAEGAEAPAMFVFSRGGDDESTGIDQLINANGELVIYDLSGRRVEKMEKGIYIVNGKKVVK